MCVCVCVCLCVCVHVHTAYTMYESLNKLQKLAFSFFSGSWALNSGHELRTGASAFTWWAISLALQLPVFCLAFSYCSVPCTLPRPAVPRSLWMWGAGLIASSLTPWNMLPESSSTVMTHAWDSVIIYYNPQSTLSTIPVSSFMLLVWMQGLRPHMAPSCCFILNASSTVLLLSSRVGTLLRTHAYCFVKAPRFWLVGFIISRSQLDSFWRL